MTHSHLRPPHTLRCKPRFVSAVGVLCAGLLVSPALQAQECQPHKNSELRCAQATSKINPEQEKRNAVDLTAKETISATLSAWFSYCGLDGQMVGGTRITLPAGVPTAWEYKGRPKEHSEHVTRLSSKLCFETYVTDCRRANGSTVNCQDVVSGRQRPMPQ